MKNILHLIDTTGPGGAETIFIELSDRLRSDRCKSVVVIRGPGWVRDMLVNRGFTPHIVDSKGSFNFNYLRQLVKIIRKEKIELIQAHLLGASVYACLAGFLTRTPVIAILHGVVDFNEERLLNVKFLVLNKFASKIVLVSKDLLKQLKERVSINESKLSIIYNGVDASEYISDRKDTLKQELRFGADDLLIGCVGNIRPAKGYDILLEAAAILVKDVDNVKFVIVGDKKNKLYNDLIRQREVLGLNDVVHFLGFREDIPSFLRNIDIFTMSSISEGCPVSVIEAMSSGVPMVVTDCGGLREMVTPDESAVMCEPGSAESLYLGLKKVIDDQELRERLVYNAKEVVEERFTMEAMLSFYRKIYSEIN